MVRNVEIDPESHVREWGVSGTWVRGLNLFYAHFLTILYKKLLCVYTGCCGIGIAQDRNEVYATELVRHRRRSSEIMKHELRTPEKKASWRKQTKTRSPYVKSNEQGQSLLGTHFLHLWFKVQPNIILKFCHKFQTCNTLGMGSEFNERVLIIIITLKFITLKLNI